MYCTQLQQVNLTHKVRLAPGRSRGACGRAPFALSLAPLAKQPTFSGNRTGIQTDNRIAPAKWGISDTRPHRAWSDRLPGKRWWTAQVLLSGSQKAVWIC